jgi:phosphatidylglycerophosphatase A
VKRSQNTNAIVLWVAQGFGAGRIPFGPGTAGSCVGLLWFFALLATGSPWLYLLGAFLGLALSVWSCDLAETLLRQKDPPSVVLDEMAAIPLCFLAWLGLLLRRDGKLPSAKDFFQDNWLLILIVIVTFRVFDIFKPWPVRESQALPGGWGVTLDDCLAAIYVNLATVVYFGWKVGF